jgi:polysaccharide export outer membrane protein
MLGVLAGGAGCPTHPPFVPPPDTEDPTKREYVLGPSDSVRINVWRNTDLSCEVIVRPDGTISMPLIGDVRAAGRPASEVKNEISQRLRAFLKADEATVTIAVTAINSYKFVVSGSVEHPGSYTSNHYVRLSEAIALAGGPNRFANPEDTVVIRRDPTQGQGAVRRIYIDYPSILSGLHPEQDLPLLPGDTIYIP